MKFNQSEFSNNDPSLSNIGYVFVPNQCHNNPVKLTDDPIEKTPCKLHVVLHGAMQDLKRVDKTFAEDSGFIEHAVTNNIVLLFPQAKDGEKNPRAAFDFWGYTDPEGKSGQFCSKDGVQVRAIKAMVDRLTGLV